MIGIGLSAGFGVLGAPEPAVVITPAIAPASSVLFAGQSLSDTENWALITQVSNYATSMPGESIDSVTVNYTGSTASAGAALADGDLNVFSITVRDTGGAEQTFGVQPRIVTHVAPTATGGLADATVARDVALTLDVTAAFTGAGLSYALAPASAALPAGLSLSQGGTITGTPTETAAPVGIVLRASNSGGSAEAGFQLGVIAYAADISGLTDTPTFGPTAQIGETLTGTLAPLIGGETIVHGWTRDGAAIAGATAASYTPVAADDLAVLRYAPLVDGLAVASPGATVRHAPPVAGTLDPVVSTEGSGAPTRDLATGFTGQDLLFTEPATWAAISGSVLTIDDVARTATLPVTATNSGGSATLDLAVEISAAAPAASISAVSTGPVSGTTLPITITASGATAGDTVHWVLVRDADPVPSAAEVAAATAAGGGAPASSGSFAWPAPASDTLAQGIAQDSYRFCVVIDNGALSNVGVSSAFEVDTAAQSQSLGYVADSDTHANVESAVTVDLSTVAAGEWLLIGVTQASGGGADLPFDTLDLAGTAATRFAQPQITNTFRKAALFKVACPAAAAGDAAAAFTASTDPDDTGGRYNVFVYRAAVEPSVVSSAARAALTTLDVSLTGTAAGNPVVVFAANASETLTFNGVPEDGTAVTFANRKHACGADNNPGGGDRNLVVTAGTGNAVAIAAEIGAV